MRPLLRPTVVAALAATVLLPAGPASAQRLDMGGIIGGIMGAAIQAEQHRRISEQQRAIQSEEQRRRTAESAARRREAKDQAAAERKAVAARATADKAEQQRQKRLATLVPAAKQAIDDASGFMQANPASGLLLDIAEVVSSLGASAADASVDAIEASMRRLSSVLDKDPAYPAYVQGLSAQRKEQNALYLADAVRTLASQKQFLTARVAKEPTSPAVKTFIPLIKQADPALKTPELANVKTLTGSIDLAIRNAGLRDAYVASVAGSAAPANSPVAAAVAAGSPPRSDARVQEASLRSAPSTAPTIGPEGAAPAIATDALTAATTEKNRFLLDGAVDDVVVMFNASQSAPHIVRNLKGEIVFEGGTAEVCLYQRGAAPDAGLRRMLRRTLASQSAPERVNITTCDAGRIGIYDVVVVRRGAFLRQDATYALPLIRDIELDRYRLLASVTALEIKSREASDSAAMIALEDEIVRGARDGFGVLIVPSVENTVLCSVYDAAADGHAGILGDAAKTLTNDLNGSMRPVRMSIDAAFVSVKRSQCGAIYASAGDLGVLIASLRRDDVPVRLSGFWASLSEIDARDKDASAARQDAERQVLERKRRTEEERRIAAIQRDELAATKTSQQEALRTQFEPTANAAAALLVREVKALLDMADGSARRGTQTARRFPTFANWYEGQVDNKWELMTVNGELSDYGFVDWKGRALETSFAKVSLRLRNRLLGEYQDACFTFGHVVDAEFGLLRDPMVAPCGEPALVAQWKVGHNFDSRWIVQ